MLINRERVGNLRKDNQIYCIFHIILMQFIQLYHLNYLFFFFKQKTAYEIVPCDWSSDVCSSDLKDFVGQEASHRFVHQQYNDQLARQGYDYTLEPAVRKRLERVYRLPVLDRLAITCALEHYTAMLGDYVLRHPEFMLGADPQMRILWSWHAAEETEHKAVAFDVYQAAGGGYKRRALWYLHVSLVFWRDSRRQPRHNLARDGRRFKLSTWASAARTWFGREGLFWRLLGPGLHYLSPRFHPWQHDNRALLQMWLERNDDAYRAIGSTPS